MRVLFSITLKSHWAYFTCHNTKLHFIAHVDRQFFMCRGLSESLQVCVSVTRVVNPEYNDTHMHLGTFEIKNLNRGKFSPPD